VDTLTVDDLLRTLGAEVPEARRNCVRLPLTVLHTGVMLHRRSNRLPEADRARPVAALVLAAGRARRFGAQKLVAPLGETTVIGAVVDAVRASGVEYVVGVTGPSGEAVRSAVACAVTWAENPDPARGMSSSVAAGIAALPPNVGAVLVVLGDQPTVSPGVVRRLVETWRLGGGPIVAPSYRGVRGNPVLFDRSMFAMLAALEGEGGARDLIASDQSRVALVEVSEAPPMDVDTPSDYGELLRRKGEGQRAEGRGQSGP
jgi:molybdenum cofactor cytidylyltransferase